MVDEPYFMNNEEWYYYDYSKKKYMLTKKAPKKAKDSYKEFYSQVYGGRGEEI